MYLAIDYKYLEWYNWGTLATPLSDTGAFLLNFEEQLFWNFKEKYISISWNRVYIYSMKLINTNMFKDSLQATMSSFRESFQR